MSVVFSVLYEIFFFDFFFSAFIKLKTKRVSLDEKIFLGQVNPEIKW